MAEMKHIKEGVQRLTPGWMIHTKIFTHQQQMFWNMLKANRKENLVISGLMNEEINLGAFDGGKSTSVIQTAGYAGSIDPSN